MIRFVLKIKLREKYIKKIKCLKDQFFIILKGLENTYRIDLSKLIAKLDGFQRTIYMHLFITFAYLFLFDVSILQYVLFILCV